jgi:hypothetical protein
MTRRAKQRARRHTHKHNQRGGAAWAKFGDTRYGDWMKELKSTDELRSLFSGLIDVNRTDNEDSSKKEQINVYLNCLAHQDKLFRTALKIIYKKLGITNVNDSKEIIAKAKGLDEGKKSMLEYIKDVENLVYFKRKATPPHNKISQMEAEGVSSITTMILFPMRLENIFIRGLSEIIVNIISDDSIIRTASNSSIKLILAVQYHSYVQSLAYTLTTYPLRDGYYLAQNVGNVESEISIKREAGACSAPSTRRSDRIAAVAAATTSAESEEGDAACTPIKGKVLETFWYKFVDRVSQLIETTTTEEVLFKNVSATGDDCTNRITDYTWEELTAHMLLYAKLKGKDMNILTKLLSVCTQPTTLDRARSQTPDATYDNVHIGDTGVTFSQLMSNVKIDQLEFLLHLEVAIKEALARRETEAATPPSGE